MTSNVRVFEIQSLSMTPTLGALVGTCGSQTVIDNLNQMYGSSGGVIFGQQGNPYQDRYSILMGQLATNLEAADTVVRETTAVLLAPDVIKPILSEEALRACPVSMQLPILMYAPIRGLMQDDRIFGYGFEKENLPEEDVFGRLINNGRVQLTGLAKDEKIPDYLVWTWKTSDPYLTDVELEHIDATRSWLDQWLFDEMAVGGKYRDPTDPSLTIKKK